MFGGFRTSGLGRIGFGRTCYLKPPRASYCMVQGTSRDPLATTLATTNADEVYRSGLSPQDCGFRASDIQGPD